VTLVHAMIASRAADRVEHIMRRCSAARDRSARAAIICRRTDVDVGRRYGAGLGKKDLAVL